MCEGQGDHPNLRLHRVKLAPIQTTFHAHHGELIKPLFQFVNVIP